MSTMTAPAKTSRAVSVGTMIDRLWELREEKKRHEDAAKKVSEQMGELEEALDAKMQSEGVDKASGKKASVSFTSSVAANVEGDEGWDKLYAYIKKTGYFHLLQRRVADTAYRELLEAGKKVPGVLPFTKKRLNLRTLA